MAEIVLKPADAHKLFAVFSQNENAPEVAGWKGNQVTVNGSLRLEENHKKLPPRLNVTGDIDARHSGVTSYKDLKCHDLTLDGNTHVQSLSKTAEIGGSLYIDKIPHKMELLEPNVKGVATFIRTTAKKFDCSGVADEVTRHKMEYHLSGGEKGRTSLEYSGKRLRGSPGQIGNPIGTFQGGSGSQPTR